MGETRREKLIEEVGGRIDDHLAMLGVLNQVTPRVLSGYARVKRTLPGRNKISLLQLRNEVEGKIKRTSKDYGFIGQLPELRQIWVEAQAETVGIVGYVPKHFLQRLFTRYSRVLPAWDELPAHALIQIHSGRRDRGPTFKTEHFVIEGSLFEDMCAFFNLAKREYASANLAEHSKMRMKTAKALWLAVITGAMNFVEAYLNGIAVDYWFTAGDKADSKTLSLLLEYDVEKERPRPLTLREKILQYPKIIAGCEHPPLQESNCPEMRFLVTRAKSMRDATVHASPKPDFGEPIAVSKKVQEHLAATFEDVEQTVLSAVALVRRIAEITAQHRITPSWLQGTDQNGLFPDSVFA
jgi:hypothetical protein